MALRNKTYVWLKIAKANMPVARGVRLLKTARHADRYGDRAIISASEGNTILLDRISDGDAIAAGKIGDTELEVLRKYESSNRDVDSFFRSISSDGHELELLHLNSGVFPKTAETIARWAETYLGALACMDLVGVWYNAGEDAILAKYAPQAVLAKARGLESYYHETPWTAALSGKRVVVVTPFGDSISLQRRRHRGKDLFQGKPDVLPDFELTIVHSPFSAALVPPVHVDWHHALAHMQEAIARLDFDVCLVGAGAYSLPLCSFVRSHLSRSAVHLGGATQILFGVRGKRWQRHPVIGGFFNEKWIAPLPHERPKGRWRNDGGAYW